MKKLLLLLLLGASGLCYAQDDSAGIQRLGVYEAIRLAQQQNPELNTVREQVNIRRAQRWSSYGIQPPSLVYMREGIGSKGFQEQRLGLSQSIDFPLISYYRLKRVDAEGLAVERQLDARLLRIKADVKKAYTDLLYAQEIVHLRRQEAQLSQELLEAVRTRFDVGESSGLDRIKAEIALAEAETGLEEAQRQFQNARYSLFAVIGLDPEDQRYSIQFPDTLAYSEVKIDQEEVLSRLDSQYELQSADRQLDAARFGVRQAHSMILPDLQLDLYPQDYGTGFKNYGFQVGLRLPVWFMLDRRSALRSSRAEVQSRTWEKQGVYVELKKEIEQAWHSYETTEATLRKYHDEVRPRAAELLSRTREGYQIGELDLLHLLDTQRMYLASEQRYYDALRNYYHHLIDVERFLMRDIVFSQNGNPPVAEK